MRFFLLSFSNTTQIQNEKVNVIKGDTSWARRQELSYL